MSMKHCPVYCVHSSYNLHLIVDSPPTCIFNACTVLPPQKLFTHLQTSLLPMRLRSYCIVITQILLVFTLFGHKFRSEVLVSWCIHTVASPRHSCY